MTLSRRGFVQAGGLAVAGLALPARLLQPQGARRRLGRPDAVREHTAEYAALCRLAGLPEDE
jgi:hypothetical protein